ncbi:MAG: hypothetical protein A2660_00795 [Candidatus Doudnabacteria bacterium RIFCSPHIGHO2_01_FULL_45_18]|uniref:Uncharacterized protein n=1 Tax=Candidatus Doudnabacteria bacterium RIFCSPHIGHO2_01_FULL_45_18 TaxID=1817823 RepID=A0A1F5NSX0_9BACT|nr:MAG: hypothetical protein A2660_00795 [Candidatus Doudnabacteria bacterium RIFCSPHIGHO2_01_FULL_45_18]
MNKKTTNTLIGLFGLLVIAGALFLLSVKYPNVFQKPGSNAPTSDFPGDFSNQISGSITAVNGNIVTINGKVKSSKPGSDNEIDKTISFTLTPQTKLTKTTMQLKASKTPYTPQTSEADGSVTDLETGVRVVRLESQEDLFAASNATAVNIHYTIFSQPNVQ